MRCPIEMPNESNNAGAWDEVSCTLDIIDQIGPIDRAQKQKQKQNPYSIDATQFFFDDGSHSGSIRGDMRYLVGDRQARVRRAEPSRIFCFRWRYEVVSQGTKWPTTSLNTEHTPNGWEMVEGEWMPRREESITLVGVALQRALPTAKWSLTRSYIQPNKVGPRPLHVSQTAVMYRINHALRYMLHAHLRTA